MDSCHTPPQSPQDGSPDNLTDVASACNETARPTGTDESSKMIQSSIGVGAIPGFPSNERACHPPIALEGPSTLSGEHNRRRPPNLSLSANINDVLSTSAPWSGSSGATRVEDDGILGVGRQSPQSAQKPDFDAVFREPNVASYGLNVAQPGLETFKFNDFSLEGEVEGLVAVDFQYYERYERAYCYPLNHYAGRKSLIDAGPLATSFDGPPAPRGWSVFVHPEGTRIFYCDDPSLPVPIVTEAWLYDEDVRSEIEGKIIEISYAMHDHGLGSMFRSNEWGQKQLETTSAGDSSAELGCTYIQPSAPVVLVLERRLTGKFGYYFVDHPGRRLFWLDEYDFSWSTGEVHIQHTERSIGLEMRSQYWKHNEHFPHLCELTPQDLAEFEDMISFSLGDVLTSNTSVVSGYDLRQLRYAQKVVDRHMRKSPKERKESVGERRTICRVVCDLYHERFLNLHGEQGVRLDSTQSIYYSTHRRKKLVKSSEVPGTNGQKPWYRKIFPAFLFPKAQARDEEELVEVDADPLPEIRAEQMHKSSPLLKFATVLMFGGPYVHASRLREITLDQIVNKSLLEKYTEKMVAEWRDVALYGTVLLGANVSFLAIQSIDTASQTPGRKTAAQRASYFSILASLGTIVSSLVLVILVRHREVMGNDLIQMRCQTRWGLESLALMYGTPFTLAIWAILAFFVSFAVIWFGCGDVAVIVIVAICLASFAIFLGWAVSASYMPDEPYLRLASIVASTFCEAAGSVADRIRGDWVGMCGAAQGASGSDTTSTTVAGDLIDMECVGQAQMQGG